MMIFLNWKYFDVFYGKYFFTVKSIIFKINKGNLMRKFIYAINAYFLSSVLYNYNTPGFADELKKSISAIW